MCSGSATLNEALLQLRARSLAAAGSLRAVRAQAVQQLARRSSPRLQPSGPRSKGDGVDDDTQEILSAEAVGDGAVLLRLTLLAAGFVVGPGGASIREVCAVTGADIRSQTDEYRGRRVRTMVLQGNPRAVVKALEVVSCAVSRYAELAGGAYCGQQVDRAQAIGGCTFYYSPPPRAAVPYAAGLLSTHDRPASSPLRKALRFSPSAASPPRGANKENAGGAGCLLALHPSPLLSTPTAARSGHLLAALRAPQSFGGAEAMEVEEAEATPAYYTTSAPPSSWTTPFSSPSSFAVTPRGSGSGGGPHSSSYSLFGSGTGLVGLPKQGPFASGPSSFASAFEGPSSFGAATALAAAAAATPCLMAPLARAASSNEDALLAASGFPSYSSFAQQSTFFSPTLFSHPAAAPAPALPQLQQPMLAAPLPQLARVGSGLPTWPEQVPF